MCKLNTSPVFTHSIITHYNEWRHPRRYARTEPVVDRSKAKQFEVVTARTWQGEIWVRMWISDVWSRRSTLRGLSMHWDWGQVREHVALYAELTLTSLMTWLRLPSRFTSIMTWLHLSSRHQQVTAPSPWHGQISSRCNWTLLGGAMCFECSQHLHHCFSFFIISKTINTNY